MHDRDVLRELVRHMNWANHEMVAACASLSGEQPESEVLGIYGSVGRTLVHLARAQGGYTRALVGWDPQPSDTLSVDAPFPGVARIDAHLAMTGAMLGAELGQLDLDRRITVSGDDGPYEVRAWVIVFQAATHATEHRQQIATALTVHGVAPPEPDLWAYWRTSGR